MQTSLLLSPPPAPDNLPVRIQSCISSTKHHAQAPPALVLGDIATHAISTGRSKRQSSFIFIGCS